MSSFRLLFTGRQHSLLANACRCPSCGRKYHDVVRRSVCLSAWYADSVSEWCNFGSRSLYCQLREGNYFQETWNFHKFERGHLDI